MKISSAALLGMLVASSAMMLLGAASADELCAGHEMLSTPRPEGSCDSVKPQSFPSPDGAVLALVMTWEKEGSQTQQPVTVDLAAGMQKLCPDATACETAP